LRGAFLFPLIIRFGGKTDQSDLVDLIDLADPIIGLSRQLRLKTPNQAVLAPNAVFSTAIWRSSAESPGLTKIRMTTAAQTV
jgi:hypothetical protein